jgi:hypothetical protein
MLANLSVWLEGDDGVVTDPSNSAVVLRWLDQSGNGNTATSSGLTPAGIDPAVINGHNAIQMNCNGQSMGITDSASLDWGTSDFSITVVVGHGSGTMWGAGPLTLAAGGGNYSLSITGSPGVSVASASGFGIVTARGKPMQIFSGGLSSSGQTATATLGGGVTIGTCAGNGNSWDIAEIIAASSTLSDAEMTQLLGYLQTKYHL